MARPLIIGLGYKAQQGKDTAASALCQFAGVERFAFADALKAYCRVAFGMRAKDPRLLQLVGTEIFRASDPAIWIRVLFDTIEERAPRVAVITDVRFPNEAEAVKAAGGLLVKVNRLNPDGTLYRSGDRDPTHSSEIALDGFDGWDVELNCRSGDVEHLAAVAREFFTARVNP